MRVSPIALALVALAMGSSCRNLTAPPPRGEMPIDDTRVSARAIREAAGVPVGAAVGVRPGASPGLADPSRLISSDPITIESRVEAEQLAHRVRGEKARVDPAARPLVCDVLDAVLAELGEGAIRRVGPRTARAVEAVLLVEPEQQPPALVLQAQVIVVVEIHQPAAQRLPAAELRVRECHVSLLSLAWRATA